MPKVVPISAEELCHHKAARERRHQEKEKQERAKAKPSPAQRGSKSKSRQRDTDTDLEEQGPTQGTEPNAVACTLFENGLNSDGDSGSSDSHSEEDEAFTNSSNWKRL